MKRIFIFLFLFLFLILEGVSIKFLPTSFVQSGQMMVPHWVLIILILVEVFFDRENTYTALLFAFVFGLLIDIVYTGILGVYMFSYGIVIYLTHIMKRILHGNFFVTLLYTILGIICSDLLITFIFNLVDVIHVSWELYWIGRLLPTVILNLVFFIILYPIFVNRLRSWGNELTWD